MLSDVTVTNAKTVSGTLPLEMAAKVVIVTQLVATMCPVTRTQVSVIASQA